MKIKKKTIIEDVKRKAQFFRLNTFLNFGSDQKTFRWLLRRFVCLHPQGLKRTGVTAVRAIEQHFSHHQLLIHTVCSAVTSI